MHVFFLDVYHYVRIQTERKAKLAKTAAICYLWHDFATSQRVPKFVKFAVAVIATKNLLRAVTTEGHCVLQAGSMTGMPQSLSRFRVEDGEKLCRDLRQLDALPVRTADTVSLYYVKRGQSKLTDMLANVVRCFGIQCQVA